MKRGLVAAVALSAGLAVVLSGCSSSKSNSSSGGSGGGAGTTTLKLVAADYGTGPSNTSQKYWQGIANAFHAANPQITVNGADHQLERLRQPGQDAGPEQAVPGHSRGRLLPGLRAVGLLYAAKDVTRRARSATCYRCSRSWTPTTAPSTACRSQPVRARCSTTRSCSAGGDNLRAADLGGCPERCGEDQGVGKVGFGLPLGPEEAQAESLLWFLGNGGLYQDDSGNWVINSSQNVATDAVPEASLVKSGVTEPNPGTKNRTDLWKQFAQGEIGMINGSPALIPIIQAAAS